MANTAATGSSDQSHDTPELRIVLIGGRVLGRELTRSKSSTGNFILGQNAFDTSIRTAQSVSRQREVHGRQVTVVDTPGWWWFYTRENTPKLDKREIQNSVHLCSPGPHAFLLVVPVDQHLYLSQIVKPSLKEHLKLFQGDVFRHTILLFAAQSPCSNKDIESKIQTCPTLLWILQQCGNRKHVLNISDGEDRVQVVQLFQKIEAMVAINGGRLYSVDEAQGNTLKEEIQALAKRASKRFDYVQKERRKLKAVIEAGKTLPEHLRLVIVGAQWAARSSAGNTILGKNAFEINDDNNKRTVHSEISHGVVAGRRLTVVDSPGWFCNHSLQDSCERDKAEIENSMYMCPPGPHAVLLAIVLGTAINGSYKKTVQDHMSLFTDDIWKHTIILFTRGDWLGVKTVEERIESEESLQWLVNRCGNRYHVLNNMNQDDTVQVKELLEKIDEMIAGNENPYHEVDQERATQIEAKREAEDKKAKRIRKINGRQSRILTELFKGERQSISDIRLVLLGRTESGKSTAGNIILLNEMFDTGFGTAWSKKDVQDQRTTATCVKHQGTFSGVKITVVDTPGWSRDTAPSNRLKGEVLRAISMCAPGPHIFLLVVPISRAFTENDQRAVLELLKPFTERVWRHCMVLFTWGDWLGQRPVEDHIAREGEALQELVEKCGNRYHILSQNYLGDSQIVKGLLQKVIHIIRRNKGCFTTEEKQTKYVSLPKQRKQPTLTEEEWNQREQTLIDRMLKALANEPDEQTLPSVKVAHSMDEAFIPTMSGDVASEYGSASESGNPRAHDNVAHWLRNQVGRSDKTSGIGSICSSASFMGRFDGNPEVHEEQPKSHPYPEKEAGLSPHKRLATNSAEIQRRYSF